jgi:MinD-like ATPase involved in chromosome partitioning or flagellar assembly
MTDLLRGLIQRFLGSDAVVLGQIPSDPAAAQAARRFLPVVESAPDSPAAHAFAGACELLLRELPAATRSSLPAAAIAKPRT